jgi:hypothetical protein
LKNCRPQSNEASQFFKVGLLHRKRTRKNKKKIEKKKGEKKPRFVIRFGLKNLENSLMQQESPLGNETGKRKKNLTKSKKFIKKNNNSTFWRSTSIGMVKTQC